MRGSRDNDFGPIFGRPEVGGEQERKKKREGKRG